MSALVTLIAGHVQPNRTWLEFGVAGGATLRQLAIVAPTIVGFDSWEGLPEDWCDEKGNLQDEKGKFRCDPPSNLPPNVRLEKGLFQDTLPTFIRCWANTKNEPFGVVHIDCDLYSSTKFVLDHIGPYLDKTVIAFDEIGPFPAGDYHEGRAWREFLKEGKYNATLIGHQHNAGAIYKLFKGPQLTSGLWV